MTTSDLDPNALATRARKQAAAERAIARECVGVGWATLYHEHERNAAIIDELLDAKRADAATIARLERQMLAWRICAQEITPGGSEYMAPEAVHEYQRDLKNRYHAAKCEVVLLQRQIAARTAREPGVTGKGEGEQ